MLAGHAATLAPATAEAVSLGALVRTPFVRLVAAAFGCAMLATSVTLTLEVVDLTAGDAPGYGIARLDAASPAAPLSLRLASLEHSLAVH